MRNVGIVLSTAAHDFHIAIRGCVGAAYVIGTKVESMRRVPTIDIGGADVVLTIIFEHAISFSALTMEEFGAVEQTDAVGLLVDTNLR